MFGISRQTGYAWIGRYRETGNMESLVERFVLLGSAVSDTLRSVAATSSWFLPCVHSKVPDHREVHLGKSRSGIPMMRYVTLPLLISGRRARPTVMIFLCSRGMTWS